MAYSELIKNFEKIRDYMRDFYVYGFRTRNDFDVKSARSYDNERRRVESWLSDYMSFRQDSNGKQIFLSVDSRSIPHNPLYKAYKAKSFTDKDIILHFYILDILMDGERLNAGEIAERVAVEYLDFFDTDIMPDDSTIRNKLKEYARIGLIKAEKHGKEIKYSRVESDIADARLLDAITFASEDNPVGVIGSFLLDKYEVVPDYFAFKHRYMLDALEQEILLQLLIARKNKECVEIEFKPGRNGASHVAKVFPIKIYVSTQNGKQYVMAYNYYSRRPKMYRLDHIYKVKTLEYEPKHEEYDSFGPKYAEHLWGTTDGWRRDREIDHVELTIHMEDDEDFIMNRVQREKRNASVELVDKNTILFKADVYDAQELVPWIRTFIGRIKKLESNNKTFVYNFYKDLKEMVSMYEVEDDDI